jgi:hypothetical protein
MKRNEVSEDQAKDDQFYPDEFEALTPALYAAVGLCGFGLCYYVINRGQSGIHKICSVHNDYGEAVKALEAFDPVLRPYMEVRIGLLVEGPAIGKGECTPRRPNTTLGAVAQFRLHKDQQAVDHAGNGV